MTPVWFENQEVLNLEGNKTDLLNVSFGPLRYCSKRQIANAITECQFYSSLMNIPSTTWILCGVVYALGCSLLVTALGCATVGCCIKEETWERVRLGAAYLQLFGGKNTALSVMITVKENLGIYEPLIKIAVQIDTCRTTFGASDLRQQE